MKNTIIKKLEQEMSMLFYCFIFYTCREVITRIIHHWWWTTIPERCYMHLHFIACICKNSNTMGDANELFVPFLLVIIMCIRLPIIRVPGYPSLLFRYFTLPCNTISYLRIINVSILRRVWRYKRGNQNP